MQAAAQSHTGLARRPGRAFRGRGRDRDRPVLSERRLAGLIEADVNQSRAAFMAGAAAFLAGYADAFEAEVGEDRYPGLPEGLAESAPRDAA
ncbi:hypothetical protein [Streptomyces sp. NPDC002671]